MILVNRGDIRHRHSLATRHPRLTWNNEGVADLVWIDRSQPQPLQLAITIAYANAAFLLFSLLLGGGALGLLGVATLVGGVAANRVANGRRLGYLVLVIVVLVEVAMVVLVVVTGGWSGELLLSGVLIGCQLAGLGHPESRRYARRFLR